MAGDGGKWWGCCVEDGVVCEVSGHTSDIYRDSHRGVTHSPEEVSPACISTAEVAAVVVALALVCDSTEMVMVG